jgi:hypothetical protein
MKKLVLLGLVTSLIFAMTGREVMDKQDKLQSSSTETDMEQMILVNSDGSKEKREIKKWIKKDKAKNLSRSLIVFYKPADIRGTALLNKQRTQTEEDQWLYIPAIHRLQRIAQGSKKNYFMGTDFTYEDLSSDKLDNYHYKILKTAKFGKDNCYVVEAKPTKEYYPKTSYGKKILWINKDKFYTEKIEFYNKDLKLIKVQTSYKSKNIKGTIYRPMFVKMDNLAEKHKTLVKINNLKINIPMSDKYFETRYLLSEQHMNNE